MSVLALIVVTQWDEARLAATAIDERPWIAHLVRRLTLASSVSRIVVACQPACHPVVAPHVPEGVDCLSIVDPLAWASDAAGVDLVARIPVWQLFADPIRLDRLAAVARPPGATLVRAVLEHEPAADLTGGTEIELFTLDGVRLAAAGGDITGGIVAVPGCPDLPELRLRGVADAGWGVTVQRALLASGCADDLAAAGTALFRAGLHRLDMWRDGAGRPPRTVLTVRCLPAGLFAGLVAHLGRVPGIAVDVMCPEGLVDATRAIPGVRAAVSFGDGPFDLAALPVDTLAVVRASRYDLCVIPRRTPCGRGFENVTPFGAASGARLAVWMDVTGATGRLDGVPYGWEPWVRDDAPWHEAPALRTRAHAALQRFSGTSAVPEADSTAAAVDLIVRRMDEAIVCHSLIDVEHHGLELTPVFLHQMPGVGVAREAVARVASTDRSAARSLATLVDRSLTLAVDALAAARPGDSAHRVGSEVRRVTDALGALAADAARAADNSLDEARALAGLRTLVARVAALQEPS